MAKGCWEAWSVPEATASPESFSGEEGQTLLDPLDLAWSEGVISRSPRDNGLAMTLIITD
jgi:hypothetical protein